MKKQEKFFNSKFMKGAIILLGMIILFSVIVFAYQKINKRTEMNINYPSPNLNQTNQKEPEEKGKIKKLSSGDFVIDSDAKTISFNRELIGGSYYISSGDVPTLKDDWKVIDNELMSLDEETLTQNNMRIYYMAGSGSDVVTYDSTNGNGATLMERENTKYVIGAYRADNSTTYTSDKIKKIILIDLSNESAPINYVATWDTSYTNGDGDVTAWLVANTEDTTMYDLYLGAEEKIYAPSNSYALFGYYKNCIDIDGLNNLDTTNVTSMYQMFILGNSLTSLDVSNFDTNKVTNMSYMFGNCSSLTSLDVSNFDTSNLTNMSDMFQFCDSLTSLDVSNFDTSNATTMYHMFFNCKSLTSLDVSGFDTSQVTDMMGMFCSCSSLTNLDVSGFDTSQVTNTREMFFECNSLTSLDVSGFDTSKVTDMYRMFGWCSSLTYLDVGRFDTSQVTSMNAMFYNCTNLTFLKLGQNFDKLTGSYMLTYCSNLKVIITSRTSIMTLNASTGLKTLTNAILYVPSTTAEATFEADANYADIFGADRIRPILELIGNDNIDFALNDVYTDKGVTVAGFNSNTELDVIKKYGYYIVTENNVMPNTLGTYKVKHTLYYKQPSNANAIPEEVMSVSRTVNIVEPAITLTVNGKTTNYASFEEVIDAVNLNNLITWSGYVGNIKLLKDCKMSSAVTLSRKKDVALDLNGHKLDANSITNQDVISIKTGSSRLRIEDNSTTQTGSIERTTDAGSYYIVGSYIDVILGTNADQTAPKINTIGLAFFELEGFYGGQITAKKDSVYANTTPQGYAINEETNGDISTYTLVKDTTSPTLSLGKVYNITREREDLANANDEVGILLILKDNYFSPYYELYDGDIKNLLFKVNDTVVNSKIISVRNYSADSNTIEVAITLTNLTKDGILSIEVPEGIVTDMAGNYNVATTLTSTMTIDNTAPTNTSAIINNGNKYTNNTTVTVDLGATGALFVKLKQGKVGGYLYRTFVTPATASEPNGIRVGVPDGFEIATLDSSTGEVNGIIKEENYSTITSDMVKAGLVIVKVDYDSNGNIIYGDEFVWIPTTIDGVNFGVPTTDKTTDEDDEKIKKAVEKYGGFYIARYEASGLKYDYPVSVFNYNKDVLLASASSDVLKYVSASTQSSSGGVTLSGKVESLKNATPSTGIAFEDIKNATLNMYPGLSRMMGPYSYRATLQFLESQGINVANAGSWGNTNVSNENISTEGLIPTGSNEAYKALNIYDLSGNAYEVLDEWEENNNIKIKSAQLEKIKVASLSNDIKLISGAPVARIFYTLQGNTFEAETTSLYTTYQMSYIDESMSFRPVLYLIDGVTDDDWLDYPENSKVSYTFDEGDGLKIINAWFKDEAGNITEVVLGEITLDTVKPVAKVTKVVEKTATISLTDDVAGINGYAVTTTNIEPNISEFTAVSPIALSTTVTYTAPASGIYYVWAKDQAGNISLVDNFGTKEAMLMERETANKDNNYQYYAIGAYRADNSTTYTADKIKKITLIDLSKESAPTTYVATWDASYTNGAGDVKAWLVTDAEDNTMYDLYLGAEGKIYAPSNSDGLFIRYKNCVEINGLNNLDTCNATYMVDMFNGCNSLTNLDVSNFDTSNVINMRQMFATCYILTNLDVSRFNTTKVTNMSNMFFSCKNLTSLDVSGFDTSKVTDIDGMFSTCSSLTSLDVNGFDTSKVTDMSSMFSSCSSLTSLNVSGFDTSKVTDMSDMFSWCDSLTNLDLSQFDTNKVTDMSQMFYYCKNLKKLDLSQFCTNKVTDMYRMFDSCSSLTSLDVSNFNVSNVTNVGRMFFDCNSLTSLDVSNFNTSNVTNMVSMFSLCSSLTVLDVSNFNTSNVTDIGSMFSSCSSLISLDVSSFDTGKVTDMRDMFSRCSNLISIKLGQNFDRLTGSSMFINCSKLKAIITPRTTVMMLDDNATTYTGLKALTNATLYVPNITAETTFESDTNYVDIFGADRIRPILELVGDTPIQVSIGATYEDAGVTVAGMSKNATSPTYTPYGYTVSGPVIKKNTEGVSKVDTNIAGAIYTLTYTVYEFGESTPGMSVTRTITVKGNISETNPNITITLPEEDRIYKAEAYTPAVVVRDGGIELVFNTDYTASYKNNINAGMATITLTGINNYEGARDVNFLISKRAVTIKPKNASKTYDGTALTCNIAEISNGSLVNGHTAEITTTGSITNVGSIENTISQLTIKDASNTDVGENYNVTKAIGTLTIYADTSVSFDITLDSDTFVYDGTAKTPNATVKVGNNVLVKGTDYDVKYINNIDAGTATILITGIGNYQGSAESKNFTITKRAIEVTAGSKSKVYDGTALTCATVSITSSNKLAANHTLSASTLGSITNVGTTENVIAICKIFASGVDVTSNYIITTKAGTLGITKATVAGSISIKGTNVVGETLSVEPNLTPANAELTYEWYYNDTNTTSNGTKISEGKTLTLTDDLAGKYIYVVGKTNSSNYNAKTFEAITTNEKNYSDIVKSGSAPILMGETSANVYTNGYILGNSSISARRSNVTSIVIKDNIDGASDSTISWDVSRVKDRSVTAWLVPNGSNYTLYIGAEGKIIVSNGYALFAEYSNCTSITGLVNLTTYEVTNMSRMFSNLSKVTSLDVSTLDTASCGDFSYMFNGCSALTSLNVSKFDTIRATNMKMMFNGVSKVNALNVSGFDTVNVRDMSGMFKGCSSVSGLDVSLFDTTNVENMASMFNGCSSLTSLDVTGFITTSVKSMGRMFKDCSKLTRLDLCSFDLSKLDGSTYLESLNGVNDINEVEMFKGCTSLKSVLFGKHFARINGANMFDGCSALNIIIAQSETPMSLSTDTGLNTLTNAIIYVPNDSSYTNYLNANNYSSVFGDRRIKRMLEVLGEGKVNLYYGDTYTSAGALVAGCTEDSKDIYESYGYTLEVMGLPVDTTVIGIHKVKFNLKYMNTTVDSM